MCTGWGGACGQGTAQTYETASELRRRDCTPVQERNLPGDLVHIPVMRPSPVGMSTKERNSTFSTVRASYPPVRGHLVRTDHCCSGGGRGKGVDLSTEHGACHRPGDPPAGRPGPARPRRRAAVPPRRRGGRGSPRHARARRGRRRRGGPPERGRAVHLPRLRHHRRCRAPPRRRRPPGRGRAGRRRGVARHPHRRGGHGRRRPRLFLARRPVRRLRGGRAARGGLPASLLPGHRAPAGGARGHRGAARTPGHPHPAARRRRGQRREPRAQRPARPRARLGGGRRRRGHGPGPARHGRLAARGPGARRPAPRQPAASRRGRCRPRGTRRRTPRGAHPHPARRHRPHGVRRRLGHHRPRDRHGHGRRSRPRCPPGCRGGGPDRHPPAGDDDLDVPGVRPGRHRDRRPGTHRPLPGCG